jgi:hypothetical protein
MASLLQGYEYRIFISYRPKDNKGDSWLSEFVEVASQSYLLKFISLRD